MEKKVLGIKKTQVSTEERNFLCQQAKIERDKWESENLGGYIDIMKTTNIKNLQEILDYANFLYKESSGTSNFLIQINFKYLNTEF